MFGLGAGEVIVILVIGLFLFGNNLPTLARSLGKSVVSFRRELQGIQDDLDHRVS